MSADEEVIAIPAAREASWPTRAVKARGWLFASGVIGVDPVTGELPDDPEAQTSFALASLVSLLEDAGSSIERIVKVNVYLDDVLGDFDRMDSAYGRFFESRGVTDPPARTSVGARLPWAKVEMDLVALCP